MQKLGGEGRRRSLRELQRRYVTQQTSPAGRVHLEYIVVFTGLALSFLSLILACLGFLMALAR